MPRRNWKLRVQDILEAIEGAREYVAGMSFEDFLRDGRTIDAVVRKITIIGEAAVHVPDSICGKSPDIPWIDMRTMRNFEYSWIEFPPRVFEIRNISQQLLKFRLFRQM